MEELAARITLKDNISTEIVRPIDAINKLKNSSIATSEAIDNISKKKVDVDATSAINKIKSVKENAENIVKRKFEVAINAIDKTKSITSKVRTELNSLVKAPATLAIKAKDETVATMSKVKSELLSLKSLAAGIVLGVAGKATIGAASQLEQEQIAMKHFISYNNQKSSSTDVQKMTDDYISKLRVEANATPFSTNEIIASGRRAVNITSGDTKQGMDLVKLSENMAALNPGKSVMDAMEALADAKTGEYERMKEFGFKITQADVQKAGGTDQYFKTQFSNTGNVGKVFNGGADELSKTTAGNWSTVTGNLESIGANFGKAFLPVINKVLTPLATLLDKNADKFTTFGESIVKVGGKIGTTLTPAFNKISEIVDSYLTPAFKKVPGLIDKYLMPVIKFVQQISNKYILPAIEAVSGVIKQYMPPILQAISGFMVKMGPILKKGWDIIQTYIIPIIQDLWGKVKDIMPGVQSLIESAFRIGAKAIEVAVDIFGKVAPVIKDMWDIISPILDGVISIFNHVADAIKTAVDWLDTWNGKGVKDNTPRLNNTPGEYDFITGKKNQSFDFYTGKKKALGTTYFEGGTTWVGENGPEILKLPGGSKIISNRESMNMVKPKNNQLSNMSFSSTIASQNKSMNPETNKWGQDIPDNLAKGIKNNTKSVTDAVTFMATKIRELIHFSVPDKGPLSDFDTYSVDMLKNFGEGIKNNTKLAIDPTTNMSTGIKNIYSRLSTASNSYGQQAIQEFGNGVQNMTNNLTDIVKTLTDKVIQQFKSGFGIHSPSKVMFEMGGHLMQGLINGMTNKDMEGFVQNWIGNMTNAAGGAISGNLSGWITTAMALTGVGPDWYGPLAQIIEHESSGNPNDINLWDYNAQHGDPSRGLMQLTGENMADYHLQGMENIYDPVSNIAAGIQYIKSRYGSVYNVPGIRALAEGRSYVGYANGGITDQPSIFGEGQYAEAAIPLKKNSSRSQQLLDIADNYINGDKASLGKTIKITIAKLADQIIVREDADIDKIATALAKKLTIAEMNI